MNDMISSNAFGDLGAFKPFKAVKKVAKGAAKVTKTVAKTAASKGGKVAAVAVAPVTVAAAVASKAALNVATKPIKAKINTIKTRRAKKLAWDRRKSTTPTTAENAEARSWVKNEFKKKGPHGAILALLAGYPSTMLGEPVTTATIMASVPAALALVNQLMTVFARSGAAPENPVTVEPTSPVAPIAPPEPEVIAAEVEAQTEEAMDETFEGFGVAGMVSPNTALAICGGISALAAGYGLFCTLRR